MQEGFHGVFFHRVDKQGRTNVPAEFRREFDAEDARPALRLVPSMKATPDPCLDGYGWDYLQKIRARMRRLPPGSDAREALEHMFGASMTVVDIDPNGRVVLPKGLREEYGLVGDIAFVGKDQTFQIWPGAGWAAKEAERDALALEEGNPLLGLSWDDDEGGL